MLRFIKKMQISEKTFPKIVQLVLNSVNIEIPGKSATPDEEGIIMLRSEQGDQTDACW
jgi:hypothetical protein